MSAPAREKERRKAAQVRFEERHPGRRAAQVKAWRERNPDKVAAYNAKHAVAISAASRRRYEKSRKFKKYGISEAEYLSLAISQCHKCAICNKPESEMTNGGFHIDHDHTTGAVRGLLCNQCNVAIGMFRHDPLVLSAAIHYLILHRK